MNTILKRNFAFTVLVILSLSLILALTFIGAYFNAAQVHIFEEGLKSDVCEIVIYNSSSKSVRHVLKKGTSVFDMLIGDITSKKQFDKKSKQWFGRFEENVHLIHFFNKENICLYQSEAYILHDDVFLIVDLDYPFAPSLVYHFDKFNLPILYRLLFDKYYFPNIKSY